MSKTDNDDALIAALQAEMAGMSKSVQDAKRASTKNREKENREEGVDLGAGDRGHVDELNAQVQRQHKIILSLRAELQASVTRIHEQSSCSQRIEAVKEHMDQTRLSAAQVLADAHSEHVQSTKGSWQGDTSTNHGLQSMKCDSCRWRSRSSWN